MKATGKRRKAPVQGRGELWERREARLRDLERLRDTLHSMGLSRAVFIPDEVRTGESNDYPPARAHAVKSAVTDAQRSLKRGAPRYLWEPTLRAQLLLAVVDALPAMDDRHRYRRAHTCYLRDFFKNDLCLSDGPAFLQALGEVVMRSDTWAKKPAARLIDALRAAVWGRAQEILFEAGKPCAWNIKLKLEARQQALEARRSRAARRAIADAVIEPAYLSESGEIVMPSALSAPGPGDDESPDLTPDPAAALDALAAQTKLTERQREHLALERAGADHETRRAAGFTPANRQDLVRKLGRAVRKLQAGGQM